jgi:alginate O-acetyltransferase complex protein AlgI
MFFNSFHFVAFFSVVCLLAVALRHRVTARNAVLLVASYYFYGCWDWRFLVLILISTLVDYACGLLFDVTELDPDQPPPATPRRKAILAVSVCTNLGLLGFFKYFDFFVESGAAFLTQLSMPVSPRTLGIVLPVGISFYTLQTLSYTIDLYRGHMKTERNLLHFALFVAFFPQLVAGPIERARRLLPQLNAPTVCTLDKLYSGFYLMSWGMFKKVVLADNLGLVVDEIWALDAPSGLAVVLGCHCFAFQLYCDFSGYSDIARGAARCMGFELMLNFNLPFLTTNPTDFWRNWHISLSSWLRDYLYYPLGGGRKGQVRSLVNIVLTMVVSGVWHGAGWPFLLMGLAYGVTLSAHKLARPYLARIQPSARVAVSLWWLVRLVITFELFTAPLIFFRSTTLDQVMLMLRSGATQRLPVDWAVFSPWSTVFFWCAGSLMAMQVLQFVSKDLDVVFRLPIPVRAALYVAMMMGIIVFGVSGGTAFVYFQF